MTPARRIPQIYGGGRAAQVAAIATTAAAALRAAHVDKRQRVVGPGQYGMPRGVLSPAARAGGAEVKIAR